MMLEHEVILPNANFTEFNPKIEGRERLKVFIPPPLPAPHLQTKKLSTFFLLQRLIEVGIDQIESLAPGSTEEGLH